MSKQWCERRRRRRIMEFRSWAYWWCYVVVVVVIVCMGVVGQCGHVDTRYLSVESSRWVVRESDGARVKLACVNWAAHLEAMVAEGLDRQPLARLALGTRGMGFNCVRLTWATHMVTRSAGWNTTVSQRFKALNLSRALRGIHIHNPALVNLTLPDAFKAAVASMARAGLYVIADNHVSQGQWCCAKNDVEGFWGDPGFAVQEWLDGLRAMALHVPNLAGISLRNELRGPKQNPSDWHRFMTMGASVVSTANPNLLIFIAGLNNDTDLHFLSSFSEDHLLYINVSTAQHKLVYEMHWYASSYGVNFAQGNLNQVCAITTSTITASGAFMVASSPSLSSLSPSSNTSSSFVAPLFISEFGVDQRGGNKASNRYINCLFAFIASLDLDWSYWALQGSYYRRYGNEGDEEYMGILNAQWNAPRNMTVLGKLQAMQQPWKGYKTKSGQSSRDYHILFHPSTGLCVQKGVVNTVVLGPCTPNHTTHMQHTTEGRLEVVNSYLCIAADGEGQPAKFETVGTERNGAWDMVSIAKLQLATRIRHNNIDMNDIMKDDMDIEDDSQSNNTASGALLCLDGSNPPLVTTRKCICVLDDGIDCGKDDDPTSQWFVLISSNLQLNNVSPSPRFQYISTTKGTNTK